MAKYAASAVVLYEPAADEQPDRRFQAGERLGRFGLAAAMLPTPLAGAQARSLQGCIAQDVQTHGAHNAPPLVRHGA